MRTEQIEKRKREREKRQKEKEEFRERILNSSFFGVMDYFMLCIKTFVFLILGFSLKKF